MKDKDIAGAIANKLAGTSDKSDEVIINDWIEQSTVNKSILQAILSDEESVVAEFDKDQLLGRIMGNIESTKSLPQDFTIYRAKENNFRRWISIAASVILLLSVTLFVYDNSRTDQKPPEQPELVFKSNPKGQKSTIFLSDGSKVFLNSGSTISFMKGFAISERKVELKGEAYFVVAPDSNRPFRVITNDITVTAIGTEFNVNSYNSDIRVSLTEGKVAVTSSNDDQEKLLNPGHQVIYNASTKAFQTGEFSIDETIAWKSGRLVFSDANFMEIKARLELWYGVDIKAEEDEFNQWSITADFSNKSLEAVLVALNFAKGIKYSIDQDYVEITK